MENWLNANMAFKTGCAGAVMRGKEAAGSLALKSIGPIKNKRQQSVRAVAKTNRNFTASELSLH
jgi:hypothetical protein